MTAPDRETPSTSWAVWAWQAYRDGRLVEARPTPLAEALAVPEVAALRVALAGLTAVLDAEDEEGDFLISAHGSQTILKRYATEKKNARAALRAIGEGK